MSKNEDYVYIEYNEKTNSEKYFIGGIHEFSIQFNENTNGYIREHLEDFIRDEDNILKLNWSGCSIEIDKDSVRHLISQNDFLIKSNRNLKERIELLENEVCNLEHRITELEIEEMKEWFKHECWRYENGKCKLGTIGTLTSDDKCPFKTRMECENAHNG